MPDDPEPLSPRAAARTESPESGLSVLRLNGSGRGKSAQLRPRLARRDAIALFLEQTRRLFKRRSRLGGATGTLQHFRQGEGGRAAIVEAVGLLT